MNESMLDVLRSQLETLQSNLRWVDLLDIAVVSIVIYWGLGWLRQRATWPVLVALLVLGVTYVSARILEMYLTSYVFQAGFLVIILSLIVVFQEDVRRAFERLAAWNPRGPRGASSPGRSTEIVTECLVETVTRLAERCVGALIVLQGRERLDRHIRGGVDLDAIPNNLLLLSIFEPHSPGHDGAVIIEHDRISRMAAHLPLSKKLTKLPIPGTRHAAALGLSERSDALVIVVSEERGAISLAQNGAIEELVSPTELNTALAEFRRHVAPSSPAYSPRAYLTRWWGLKAVSVVCAVGLWLLFGFRVETVHRSFVVPVEFQNIPEGWSLEHSETDRVRVTLSGPRRAFDLLDPETLLLSVDLSQPREGQWEIDTTRHNLNVPNDLIVEDIQPPALEVTMVRVE